MLVGAGAFVGGTALRGLTTELLGRGRTSGALKLRLHGITMESTDAVDVVVARVTFAPNGTTGWQAHAGPVLVLVERGALTRYSADDSNAQTYTSGHAFVQNDPNGGDMLRNEGPVDAEAIVTFIAAPPWANP